MSDKFKFKDLKVYSSTEWFADNKKNYRQVYNLSEASYIYAELSFYNKLFDKKDWDINVNYKCYKSYPIKKEICDVNFDKSISKDKNLIFIREGWGNKKKGIFWESGSYYWEAYMEGELQATKHFYFNNDQVVDESTNENFLKLDSFKLYEGIHDYFISKPKSTNYISFDSETTRYIHSIISFKNLAKEDWWFELFINYYNETRDLKGQIVRFKSIKKDDDIFEIDAGWGSNTPGSWRKGNYLIEIVFMNQILQTVEFTVGDEFEEGEIDISKIDRKEKVDNSNDNSIKLTGIPKDLQVAIQQYLLFFRDYVRVSKNQEIAFDVNIEDSDLVIEIKDEKDIETVQLYLYEYLEFAKQNFVGIINVEGNPSTHSVDILRMRLEQQVNNLNMELKFKELQVETLKEETFNHKNEKLLLLNIVNNSFYANKNQAKDQFKESPNELKGTLKDLIGENKIDKVFNELVSFLRLSEDPSIYNDSIQLKSKWIALRKESLLDKIPYQQLQVQKSKIISALIEIIEQL